MIKVYDDLFDKKFLVETSHFLTFQETWKANNTYFGPHEKKPFPYSSVISYLIMGHTYFSSSTNYTDNSPLTSQLFSTFNHLLKNTEEKTSLDYISANLQFKGMNTEFHVDGREDQMVFIWMLSYFDVDKNEGGEFIHQPTNTKIPFVNGRIIKMTASDLHKGVPFTKDHTPRLSIKFKFTAALGEK